MLRSLAAALILCAALFALAGDRPYGEAVSAPRVSVGGEASLTPKLRGVIAWLRGLHGRHAVTRVGGARSGSVAGRPGMPSCHNGGRAFDAHLSAAAVRSVLARRDLGVITYSGHMRHVHVSDCVRERGYRGHKRT